jgi:peptidoglycan/LPS O-acetylase OafA/YrhL
VNKKEYVVQLDGLRFFAVLMVMIAHWLQWQLTNPIFTNFPFNHGVTLFFVLSGYLISRILFTNNVKYIENNQSKSGLLKSFYI